MSPSLTSSNGRAGDFNAPERSARRRLFVAVAGGTFLLVGLLVLRPKPKLPQQVSIILRSETATSEELAFPAESLSVLTSKEQIAEAFSKLRQQDQAGDAKLGLDEFAAQLGVSDEAVLPAKPGKRRLTLEYSGKSPSAATVLNNLAESYVEQHFVKVQQSAKENHETAQRAAADAERRVANAGDRLRKFVAEHREQLQTPSDSENKRDDGDDTAASVEPEFKPNPLWEKYQAEVSGLEQRRFELLKKYTTAHPLVQHLDARLELVNQELSQTPQLLISEDQQKTRPPDRRASEQPLEVEAPLDEVQIEKLLAEQRELEQAVEEAQLVRQTADAQFAQTADALKAANRVSMFVENWAVRNDSGESGRALWFSVALIAAVACGAAVSLRGVPDNPTLRSVDEIEACLELSVVGAVPDQAPALETRNVQLPRWATFVKWGGMLVVVAVMACLVVLIIADGEFLGAVCSDPLSIFTKSWQGMGRLLT